MTELDLAVPFSGIDPRGRVKFSVLLEMFQEMADADASKYGLSVRQTLEHNITWVLRKYRIELEKYPTKESGDIHIKTYQALGLARRVPRLGLHLVGAARLREAEADTP